MVFISKKRNDSFTSMSLYTEQLWRIKDTMRSLRMKTYPEYVDYMFKLEDEYFKVGRSKGTPPRFGKTKMEFIKNKDTPEPIIEEPLFKEDDFLLPEEQERTTEQQEHDSTTTTEDKEEQGYDLIEDGEQ